MHADSRRLGHLHTPMVRSSKSDASTLFHTLLQMSWYSDHTNCALVFTQHSLGQSWSQILQFWTGCSFLHYLTCEFHTLMPPEHGSETKFVAGAVPERLDLVVHLQLWSWSLYSGDSSGCFDRSSVPAGFLPHTDTDKH